MSYFGAGLWHCGAALAFAAALGLAERGEAMFRLRDVLFLCTLFPSSCALFPMPEVWAKRGLWKFLHYPLPDWDVLLLGIASHRHWITHSAWLPLTLAYLKYFWRSAWPFPTPANSLALGLCVGIASHLFWDLAGSRSHSIVVVPHWWTLRARASRVWLVLGVAASIGSAAVFADPKYLRALLEPWL